MNQESIQNAEHYIERVLNALKQRDGHEKEFIQAAEEMLPCFTPVLASHPEYERLGILERFAEPERVIQFQVPWTDDGGQMRVNRGFRVQFNGAIGPYKGGLRFNKGVTLGQLKFLGLEQTLKNALTGLPMGGGKGGTDFDPHGKSEGEVRRFCQSFMTELYRHIGPHIDVPAGDLGVGAREIGFLFGQYRRLTQASEGVLTGKGLSYGGAIGRREATGYGLGYFVREMLALQNRTLKGLRVLVSGSGNVAIYAAEKAAQLGALVIAMSDSDGAVIDENGIRLDVIKQIKEVERGRIREYAARVPGSRYLAGADSLYRVPADIAFPCATQNELSLESAQALTKNGVFLVAEGANMPTTPEAVDWLTKNGVLFAPGKAANAGGVSVSGLEMSQNAMHTAFSREEVDARLNGIMTAIHENVKKASLTYAGRLDYVQGANIAGFARVAEAMAAQG